MANGLLRFFATGDDIPESTDRGWIDAQYRRHRLRVMLAITLGYALIYTCRLAISMVKKPLIDGGIFSAEPIVPNSAGVKIPPSISGFLTTPIARRHM